MFLNQPASIAEPLRPLVDTLLADDRHHIEFHGYLTNHAKHATIALAGLGAPADRIVEFGSDYARNTYGFGLEPRKEGGLLVREDEWLELLGQRREFAALLGFFTDQAERLPWSDFFRCYVPRLLDGSAGALFHALIHLGWALHVEHREMAIEGLAYLAYAGVNAQVDGVFQVHAEASPLSSLVRLSERWHHPQGQVAERFARGLDDPRLDPDSGFCPELKGTGAQFRIAQLLSLGDPETHGRPRWVEELELSQLWSKLHEAILRLYLCQPGDFVLLHLITSAFALEQVALHLPEAEQRRAVRSYWTGVLAALIAVDGVPQPRAFDAPLFELPRDVDSCWAEVIARAIADSEEHNAKLVYVMKLYWARFGPRPLFLAAARAFTQTPQIK